MRYKITIKIAPVTYETFETYAISEVLQSLTFHGYPVVEIKGRRA